MRWKRYGGVDTTHEPQFPGMHGSMPARLTVQQPGTISISIYGSANDNVAFLVFVSIPPPDFLPLPYYYLRTYPCLPFPSLPFPLPFFFFFTTFPSDREARLARGCPHHWFDNEERLRSHFARKRRRKSGRERRNKHNSAIRVFRF